VLRAVVLTQYRRMTDKQTDGIAIATTAHAMRALRRAVKKTNFHQKINYTLLAQICLSAYSFSEIPLGIVTCHKI